jgi:tRNA/tmRNA/rRNA uracil-C5-methylase (TrmA/RlmC/RlmD family)
LTDILNIPNRFYEAFCANLALKLAQKDRIMGIEISPDKMANLIQSAAKSMEDIEQEDTEHAPYIFQFNL